MARWLFIVWAVKMIKTDSLERVMAGSWSHPVELSSSFLTLVDTALFQSGGSLLSPWESGAIASLFLLKPTHFV